MKYTDKIIEINFRLVEIKRVSSSFDCRLELSDFGGKTIKDK